MPGRVVPPTTTARVLGEAAAAFLAQPDLAASTRRSYQQTLGRLERELGADRSLATLTAEQMTAVVIAAWAGPITPEPTPTDQAYRTAFGRSSCLHSLAGGGLQRPVSPSRPVKQIRLLRRSPSVG